MAVTAFTPTTTVGGSATLVKLQRKVQGDILYLFQRTSKEYALAKKFGEAGLDMSGREVTRPVQFTERGGGAFIEDGGYEAEPRSVAPDEETYTFTQYNDRVSITGFARMQDQANRAAMIARQIKFQVDQMANGFGRRFAQCFWGLSSGLVCKTSTNATSASQTLTLIDAFGLTETGADNAAYLDRQFCVKDRISVIRSGSIVSNGFGTITAKTPATPSIAVTMVGSCDVDANDEIYFAQSVRNDSADTNSTDLNKWPVGLTDATDTTTVHNVSSSSVPESGVAYSDTNGGRLNGTKLKAGQHAIQNKGGDGPYTLLHSQGIERDIFNQQVAAVRFQDPMTMRLDGAVKVGEGIAPFVSKWNVPGRAVLMPTGSVQRWFLNPMPDDETGELPDYGDQTQVDKVPDRSAHYIGIDAVFALIHKRSRYAKWTNLQES